MLQKPFDLDVLLEVVRRAMDKRQVGAASAPSAHLVAGSEPERVVSALG